MEDVLFSDGDPVAALAAADAALDRALEDDNR
jgi:hypothetical protein